MEQIQPVNSQPTEYRDIQIAQLQESPTNPRKRFNEESLNELAASFKSQGVLAPLVVRPVVAVESEAEQFEVVAGARRLRAARLAGLASVPVRIVQLSDTAAIETQVVENLQREDIHPLEEANGFRSLVEIEAGKYTIADIAAKCGKSEAYVVNRIKLTELIGPVAEAFLANKITIGHALLIAKLPAAHQQEAFNASFRQMWTSEGNTQVLIPVRELAAWIQSNILLELAAAPFSKNDAELVPQAGSCAECPKRTGFNSLLFSEVRKDSCTDPQCFRAKVDAHVAKTVETKPKLVQISSAWTSQSREGAPLGRNQYVEIESAKRNGKAKQATPVQKPCRSMTEAIYMDGGRRGQTVKVCADFHCKTHHAERQHLAPETVERQRAAERKRIQQQKLQITTRHRVLAAILAKTASPLTKNDLQIVAMFALEKLEYNRATLIAKRHGLLKDSKSDNAFQESRTALVKLVKDSDETALSRLLVECALLDSAYHEPSSGDDRLLAAARKHRIDVDAVARAVRDEFATKAKKAVRKEAKSQKTSERKAKTSAAV
jgi:ParB family transcriptional regulator, chromosome partitioning protein